MYYLNGSVNQESGHAVLGLSIRVGLIVFKADVSWPSFSSRGSSEGTSTSKVIQLLAN